MAKGFSQNNPLYALSGADTKTKAKQEDKKEEVAAVEPKVEPKAEPKKEAQQDAKRKPGRPKTKNEATKTINIAVPVSILDKINVAKAAFDGNLTRYINHAIENDLAENYKGYEDYFEQRKKLIGGR